MLKFPSILGFSISSGHNGDKVKIGFIINCKNSLPENGKSIQIFNILDNIAYPEILRRIKDGKLSADYRLHKVHAIMFSNESRNDILLNEEVRFKGLIKLKEGKTFDDGHLLTEDDIEDILALYPNEKNDPNAAHIMLVKFKGQWLYACNLIYDREKVRKRFETSKMFYKVADYCKKENLWGPFVDNLFSATELSIQSILLLHHHPRFSINQTHDETENLFDIYATNGNLDTRFSKQYSDLDSLRKKGRYVIGLHDRNFTLGEYEADKMMAVTYDLFKEVEKLLEVVDFSRKPPVGDYVEFGGIRVNDNDPTINQ